MKYISSILLSFFCMITSVSAESYCVLSGNDQEVLEEKNMHEQQSVASISKVMTAYIALKEGNLEDQWNVSKEVLKAYGSSVYLKVGQTITLKDALYGLMLRSGNDCAIEIATHIAGSKEAFVEKMNTYAKTMNMQDTIFRNPSGLDEEDGGNLSSAYDMAILMQHAMELPAFQEIVSTTYYDTSWGQRWKNKNQLLFQYEPVTGGKTGYTKKAGRTLITSASQNQVDSIVVTLNMQDDFTFHQQQHEQVFADYEVVTICPKQTISLSYGEVEIDKPIEVTVKKDGSDQIEVTTQVVQQQLQISIKKNDIQQDYVFPIQ